MAVHDINDCWHSGQCTCGMWGLARQGTDNGGTGNALAKKIHQHLQAARAQAWAETKRCNLQAMCESSAVTVRMQCTALHWAQENWRNRKVYTRDMPPTFQTQERTEEDATFH